MSELVYYLAYGSNLHPKRLQARCPSANWLQTTYLRGYQLSFNCKGSDDSGKGNLIKTEHPDHRAVVAVYSMLASEKPILDEIEGAPYRLHYLQLDLEHGNQECFIYLAHEDYVDDSATPYHWYKELIYWGAHYNNAHPELLEHIDNHHAKTDTDAHRNNQNKQLVDEIIASLGL
jgi:gamma-glutamylcyclotransferase